MNITKTIGRSMPDGSYIEATVEERDGSDGLSPGFSVTGHIWEKSGNVSGRARKRLGRDIDTGGQVVEEILRAFPKLQPLLAVHLASPNGVPMHALANGWYYYSGKASAYERERVAAGDTWRARHLGTSDHDRAAQALRIPPEKLPTELTEQEFATFVDTLAARWELDAWVARAVLENLVDGDGVEAVR